MGETANGRVGRCIRNAKRRAKNSFLDTPSGGLNTVGLTNLVAGVQGPDSYVNRVIIDSGKTVGIIVHPCRF